MNSTNENTLNRALFIDFELYAENDPVFKEELIDMIIENLHELQQAYNYSVERHDPEVFRKACHKVKTTISMLADQEFDTVVEDLKSSKVDQSRVSFFNKLSAGIIASLLNEKVSMVRTGTI
jgi:hypothetical protein